MAQANRLRQIGEDEPVNLITDPPPPRQEQPATIQATTTMLLMALKALSQRTVIALASLVDLALVSSVFVLWLLVISQPTFQQLIGLGGYAMFVLVALFMRRRSA